MKSKRAREAATEAEDFLPVEDIPVEKKRKRGDDETGDDAKQKKAKKDKRDKKDKNDKNDKKKKKDQKESRKEKKDKRKNLQDLPEADVQEDEPIAEADESKKEASPSNPSSSDKPNGDSEILDEAAQAKKEKKAVAVEAKETQATDGTTEGDAETGKNARHIVFVGNLPFSATAETIKAHFASLNPISVRCLKNKDDPNPCRGIAFVEFANVWTMRTCLDKFHHTVFEDGVSAGRKINVELTAGGGGGTKFRKDKIREKNKKLEENRSKRIEKERNAKTEGRAEGGTEREDYGQGGIHPSRLARNPRLAT